jgi:hypothetical protein
MKPIHFGVALLVVASSATVRAQDKPTSKDLKALFEKAETLELYSLDPGEDFKEPDVKKGFYGWKILGKTTIKDAKTRKKIVEALYRGLEESDGTAAKCFYPRHGLRATVDGKTADIVICYQCRQMEFRIGAASAMEPTNDSAARLLNEVLTTAGVPLAPTKK